MGNWQPWVYPGHWSIDEHNAVLAELRKAELELDRMGKANNEACDRIRELETLNDALVKDLSFYRDEYQPVSAARDKAEARVRELETQLAAVQPAPTAPTYAQIETLARAMDESWETVAGGEYFTGWHQQTDPHRERRRAQARAAYEHIGFGLTHCPNCGDRLHKAECDNCTAWALRWHELVAKHESELARVTAERDGWETDCKRETENVKYWREQLVTRPVKVMFNCTAKDVAWEFANTDWSEADIAIAQTCMDYLAARAVVDVPPGVPTVEELARIGYEVRCSPGAIYANQNHEDEWAEIAAAIRDAVLAGVGECQECAAAKRAVQIERDGVNALAARITAARAALEGEA